MGACRRGPLDHVKVVVRTVVQRAQNTFNEVLVRVTWKGRPKPPDQAGVGITELGSLADPVSVLDVVEGEATAGGA